MIILILITWRIDSVLISWGEIQIQIVEEGSWKLTQTLLKCAYFLKKFRAKQWVILVPLIVGKHLNTAI